MPLSDVALVLGPVQFQGFEIPERIGFGGQQRLAVHDMPGGQRVIDTLGPTPADIAWSGIFSGPSATLRARTLDALRVQAAVLTLSWDVFFFNVVISRFQASFRNSAWVPYEIRVSVLIDADQQAVSVVGDLLGDVLGDAASAAGFAALAGVGLAALQTTLAAPNATVLQSSAYVAAQSALAGAQTSVESGLNTADTSLGGYAKGLSSAAAVASMIGAAGNAAGCASANAFLGRISANLTNAGT
jgi:hypothetical protein